MKRFIFIFFCFSCARSLAQQDSLSLVPWGTWGVGDLENHKGLKVFNGYNIEGYHLYFNWSDLEPVKNEFQWQELDDEMQIIADSNLWIGLQIQVGQNSPSWIYNTVPEVTTTGGGDPGPYPYYFDPDYRKRYFNLLKKVAGHLRNLPDGIKSHLYYWQITEGSTGDEQPYKGDPVDTTYAIDYYVWEDFRHECWDSAVAYAGNDHTYKFLFNSGNMGQDLAYVEQRFPGDLHKDGWLSHKYSFDGESLYYPRQLRDINQVGFQNRSRGEVQGIYNYVWWELAPVKQSFTLACSALSGGLDMINVGAAFIEATLDPRPTNFYREYAGLRNAAIADRGFIALRDVPDFADSIRFPEDVYGRVIDPTKQKTFLKTIKGINDNEKDSAAVKFWKHMQAVAKYLNPSRRDKIIDEFAPMGALYNDLGDDYHNDFGINMTKDFARYIRQVSPDSTSIGAWRVGADSSIYGRYARMCKLDNHQHGEMFFFINPNIKTEKQTLTISVVYYDDGRGVWAVNGSGQSFVFKNKDTKKWQTQVVTIENFRSRQLLNGRADFSIEHLSGGNNPFTLIEVSTGPGRGKLVAEDTQVSPVNLNLKLSPNPNKGRFTVELTAPKNEIYSVFVTDVIGSTILSENKSATAGTNTWSFSSPKLQKGVYVLHVQSYKANINVTRNFLVDK